MSGLSPPEHLARFGPTVGDRIRLGDTDLWVRVGEDRQAPGDEPLVNSVKRVVRGDPDDPRRVAPDLELQALTKRRFSDSFVGLANRAGPVGRRQAASVGRRHAASVRGLAADPWRQRILQHDQARPFVEEDLQADVVDQFAHALHDLSGSDRSAAGGLHVRVPATRPRRLEHGVADEGHRFRLVEWQPGGTMPTSKLGGGEDEEPLLFP